MKKILTLILSLTFVHFYSMGQCTSSIPANATVISSNQTVTANNSQYWVCSGTLDLNGNGNTLYVEEGAGATVTGTNNTINAKDLVVSQSDEGLGSNIIYIAGIDDVLSSNMDDQINGCSAIAFNYSNAPANGCAGGTGIEDQDEQILLEVFPNPVINDLNILIENATCVDQVSVIDVRGREMLREPGKFSMKLDLSSLPSGFYSAVIDTDRGQLVRKIRKD
ncbi:MAG: T9SS type A sorting domain-containing protein [Bacteroidota bacterium]|nr:T9SS type A sorting domain-containing protein [Bacteroidota bacterium]